MESLPSPAIRLLAREILNRTEVDAADSVVLVAHTHVLSLSYFGCILMLWLGFDAQRCHRRAGAMGQSASCAAVNRKTLKRRCERWRSRRSPQRRLSRPRS